MTGDGLSDLVRVRNGEVCYWPNLGYGRFGAKVTMDGAPALRPTTSASTRAASGSPTSTARAPPTCSTSATTACSVCFNQSGNAWSAPTALAVFPRADSAEPVQVIDLLGTGTACLVWSSPLPGAAPRRCATST